MNRAKRFLLLLITILITLGICGCTGNVEQNPAEKMRTEALAYLNSNYSDIFTAKLFTASNWAYEYDSITFTSEKYPGEIVEVRVYTNDDGTYRFKDNYYHCYMMDSAVSYGNALMAGENAVVKVRFEDAVWSDRLAGAQTFEEWIEHGPAYAEFFVITGDALSTDMQTGIVRKIADDKVYASVTFFTTEEENLLQDIPLDEILNNTNKFVVSQNKYFINSQFEIEII